MTAFNFTITQTRWQDEALCLAPAPSPSRDRTQPEPFTIDPELFYHPEGARGTQKKLRERAAKAICAQCPVRPSCAAAALESGEKYGIWGGLTEEERERITRAARKSTNPTTGTPFIGCKCPHTTHLHGQKGTAHTHKCGCEACLTAGATGTRPTIHQHRSSEVLLDEIQHLRDCGLQFSEVCTQLGLTREWLTRLCGRAGRQDLARDTA